MIPQVLILESHRQNAAKVCTVLNALPLDKPFRVTVEDHKARRSDPQNRYLWGVVYATILNQGGEALRGWTNQDLHDYFLGEHFGWETISGFGRKRIRPLRRSSKLNKQEFSDYLAFIQQKAAELGIYIPDSKEYLSA